MAYATLDMSAAVEIKKRIWHGEKQDLIGTEMAVSQATISHIVTGRRYHEAPWPDGTYGALPLTRKKELRFIMFPGVRADHARKQKPNEAQIVGAVMELLGDKQSFDDVLTHADQTPHQSKGKRKKSK